MDPDLLKAILAMDTYNRGYDVGRGTARSLGWMDTRRARSSALPARGAGTGVYNWAQTRLAAIVWGHVNRLAKPIELTRTQLLSLYAFLPTKLQRSMV